MKKKGMRLLKIILIIILIVNIFAIYNTKSYADDKVDQQAYDDGLSGGGSEGGTSWWDNVFKSANDFLGIGKNAAGSGQIAVEQDNGNIVEIGLPSDSDLQVVINDIYGILFPLAVGITVIIGGVLGIKFMMASVEDKAKIKESMVPYVVGCVVIYGAFGIWKLAITIFSMLG